MLYDITLRITYEYDYPADSSRHVVRLMPADLRGEQRLIAGNLDITPRPAERSSRTDFFGNQCVDLSIAEAHEGIVFLMQSRVERFENSAALDMSPDLAGVRAELADVNGVDPSSPHNFVAPSARVPIEPATTGYARQTITADSSAFRAVIAIGQAIHRDMTYDPEATTVDTPMVEAFEGRRGVCQDYSHIMIAALRGVGIPSGYVSGFLRTIPPKGKTRLEGADAMHAWVKAWCGHDMGWVEYDPTNGMAAGADHVVIARGRDYADVAPIKGVMRTYGDHTTEQSVDVIPVK